MQQRRPQRDAAQPFDQRFLLFAMMSVGVLMLYNSFFAPPPVEQPAPGADKPDAVAQLDEAGAEDDEASTLRAAPVEDDATAEPVVELAAEDPPAQPQRLTLGSVAPDGPYRMLVTLNNLGGGVERVEFSSDSYRDLEDRTGYLGHLALSDAPLGGATVGVVGPGTPAAEAGLLAGDLIKSAQTAAGEVTEIGQAKDLRQLLAESKPGQVLTLSVRRDGAEQTLTATLRRHPLDLMRPERENIALHDTPLPAGFKPTDSFLVRLTSVNGRNQEDPQVAAANRRLREEAWRVERPDADTVVMRMPLPELGVEVSKRLALTPVTEEQRADPADPSYHFDLSVEARNLSGDPKRLAYELTGPNGLPIEGFWFANKVGRSFGAYGLRDVVVRFADGKINQISCQEVAEGDVDPMGQGQPLAFVGVDAQYFASIVMPLKESLRDVRVAEVRAELATPALNSDKARPTWDNASFVLAHEPVTLEAGQTLSDGYRVFAGPKLPALLRAYRVNDDPNHSLADVLYYGWFGPVAKLMLGLLHMFYGLVGNYGIAIVLLTVVVRGAMFPISRQQALNMVKMQQLKPEMDRIAERYKEDMQKRAQAQQELFRKHNYNPAAGCLPLFLQLPIFLGLYRALSVDVELRQAPLFTDAIRFCSNLAAPDMLYDWSWLMPHWVNTGQGMLGLGPYFNLLPIATVVLFLLQQKMFMPEPTNDQARLQQQMMKYMMGFMGLLFFKVPSGLCIYFIASSLWGIAERKMLPKPQPVEGAPAPAATPAVNPKAKTGSNGELARARAKRKKSGGKKRK